MICNGLLGDQRVSIVGGGGGEGGDGRVLGELHSFQWERRGG